MTPEEEDVYKKYKKNMSDIIKVRLRQYHQACKNNVNEDQIAKETTLFLEKCSDYDREQNMKDYFDHFFEMKKTPEFIDSPTFDNYMKKTSTPKKFDYKFGNLLIII